MGGFVKPIQEMKKYIGTKEVQAQPMSAELAISKGFKTSSYTGKDEGYEVIYKDGYSSWSPKEIFEEAYKLVETPLDRLYVEYNDLLERHNKLVLFLGRKDAVQIAGEIQVELMELQKIQMKDYLRTLRTRIELMKK